MIQLLAGSIRRNMMRFNDKKEIVLDLGDPMTLVAISSMRRAMIDQGGYRNDVRRLDALIAPMIKNLETFADDVDSNRKAFFNND